MLKEFVQLASAELTKQVAQKVGDASAGQASAGLKALARTSLGGASLLPGAGLFIAGVALGAGLGLLFAPRPGRETRRALGAGLRRLASRRAR
ncbi:MAG TPA: YtxH domain-containing protein [Polyangiaceae bacterium]|nr:YtxH domain-containing protein [Polyangiaceae bacterium]